MTLSVAVRHDFPGFALDVSFEAPPGVTALFGRSGSGKTTVINAVAGLLEPAAGRVAVAGRVLFDSAAGLSVPPAARRVGYVFQDARLFPHMTVRGNLLYGQRLRGTGRESLPVVAAVLGLRDLLDRRPASLSGGERQRVAIGRALLSDPDILLMDEPLAALDEARKDEILPLLERLRDVTQVPVIYVSHSMAEVARLATTIVVIEAGRVAACGPAGDVLADPGLMPLIGPRSAGAVLAARVVAQHAADGLTELAVSAGRLLLPRIEAAPGTSLKVRIEAGDITLSLGRPEGISALNLLPATVTGVHPGHGPGAAVALRAGSDRLLARITRRSVREMALEPGTAVWAILKATSVTRSDIGG
jgi:molybdate transport system ATP-binding protein